MIIFNNSEKSTFYKLPFCSSIVRVNWDFFHYIFNCTIWVECIINFHAEIPRYCVEYKYLDWYEQLFLCLQIIQKKNI